MLKDYRKLLRFLKPHKLLLILAIFCMLMSSLFDFVSLGMIVPLCDRIMTDNPIILPEHFPDFMFKFVGQLNSTPPNRMLLFMCIGMVLLFAIKGFFTFWRSYLMSNVGQKVIRDIRNILFKKIQSLSLDYFTQKRSGELISRITNDVRVVENALSYGLSDMVYQSFQVVIFSGAAFYIYWKMGLIVFLIVPALMLPIIQIGRRLRKLARITQEKMADINSSLVETITGIRIVKAFSQEDYEVERFKKHNFVYYKTMLKSIKRTLALSPLTELIGGVMAAGILFFMGRYVIGGFLSFGVFGLFVASLLSMIRPFKKLSQVHSLNEQAVAASKRIYEVLDVESKIIEKPNAADIKDVKKGVEFKGVWFKYEDEYVLSDINLKINPGSIVALVGLSGAGKSTLADLVVRFYDPQKGSVSIDDIGLRELKVASLRKLISVVTQETILFNDTIKANIAYGKLGAVDFEIIEAAKRANAYDFIQELPNAFETVISDRGIRLSGGQRQRIAIARAILKNPPILLLDEATSQLDSESERLVQQALNSLMENRTVIVIAHRLSTIKRSDKIVVLDKGKITGMGTHEQLLSSNPLYSRLYHMQWEDKEND